MKLSSLFQPIINISAWVLVLFLGPRFSIGTYAAKYFTLTPTEIRNIDLASIIAFSTVSLKFLDCIFEWLKRPVELTVYFENAKSSEQEFTLLDPPSGSPQRVRLFINLEYKKRIAYSIIRKLINPMDLEVTWLDQWIQIELENTWGLKPEIFGNTLTINLHDLADWPGGRAKLVLTIVTRNDTTQKGYLTPKLKLSSVKRTKWFIQWLVKIMVIKSNKRTHELRLSDD